MLLTLPKQGWREKYGELFALVEPQLVDVPVGSPIDDVLGPIYVPSVAGRFADSIGSACRHGEVIVMPSSCFSGEAD